MVSEGVTTEADLKATLMAPEEVASEVAEELAHDAEIQAARQRQKARQAITMDYSKADHIEFYRINGQRCAIACGTDPDTKERLKTYYLKKLVAGKRVFFAQPPPGTERGEPRWRCFVENGTGQACGKPLYQATNFLGHLLGFHRNEADNYFPEVIARLQGEAQKELQPAALAALGLGDTAEPFEMQGEDLPELHWCKENGHPDCPRFFDSPASMEAHQRGHKKEERDGEPAA